MALVSCPECNNQVSDAAVACPSCGHPLKEASPVTVEKPEPIKNELFKAGGANLVLAEIAAIACVKTRNWVYAVIGLPLVIAVIFAWMSLDWPLAAGITFVGLVILGFIHVDQGSVASTGNITDIDEDMDKVTQRYHDSIDASSLVIYKGRNTFQDMHFSINPERIAEFSQASSNGHIWFYALGIGAFIAGFQYYIPLLYIVGAVLICFGFLSRKAALQITGVGGAKMELYTRASDIKQVIQELTQSIESGQKA
ncbi:zinc ribbon domain-containing protein [Amphritea japonica]|uniref:Zinc-ribbon domain-containing protein n=1 Tax=Amphritea japonica ATCC BAA-1530 TaxID=1278309 RepID=A0A7R6SS33_9GAMM|nr:zinc ribbon domain-containing protein [Amphritea japonica]BBB25795.1 conserved hypothetical protein [Amphritea japonica ATCC BAA-1530]